MKITTENVNIGILNMSAHDPNVLHFAKINPACISNNVANL